MVKSSPLARYTPAERRVLGVWVKLNRATESVGARLREHIAHLSLTLPQFGVLEMLYHLGPLCQKEIGTKLLRTGGNITMVIDNLERQGLVQRRTHPQDRRYHRIHLTVKGNRVIEEAIQYHLKLLVSLFSNLTTEEQNTLAMLCRRLGHGVVRKENFQNNNPETK